MSSDCPWADDNANLANLELKATEKYWLAREVLSGRTSAAKLAKLFNLRRNTIIEWVRRIRKGGKLYDKGGRPPCLDERSVSAVVQLQAEHADLNENQIKGIIEVGHADTVSRNKSRYVGLVLEENTAERRLSRRSMSRYFNSNS